MFAALQKKLVVLHSTLHQHTNFPKKSRRATSKTGLAFYTTTTPLLHHYYTTTTLLLHYYYTTTTLLLHYYYTTTTLLLHYYYTTTTLHQTSKVLKKICMSCKKVRHRMLKSWSLKKKSLLFKN